MAGLLKKISELSDGGSALSIADIFAMVQSGTTKRATVGQLLQLGMPVVNAKDPAYGSFQDAADDVPTGGIFYFPHCDDILTDTISITGGMTIMGVGNLGSKLTQSVNGKYVFDIATSSRVDIKDMYFNCSVGTPTGGGAVKWSGSGGVQVNRPRITRCTFEGFYTQVQAHAANQFAISDSDFLNPKYVSILCDDPLSNDSGINNNFFNTGDADSVAAVLITGCPGINVSGRKILGYKYGILVSLDNNTSTMTFTGISIENQAIGGIWFQLSTAGKTIGSVVVGVNEFAQTPYPIYIANNGPFMENCAIVGNTLANFTDGISILGGYRYACGLNQLCHGTRGLVISPLTYVVTGETNSCEDVATPLTGTPVSGY